MPLLAPLATRASYLAAMKQLGDHYHDPVAELITVPIPINIHVEYLDQRVRHPTRESLYYALVLLVLGGGENLARAAKIVERIVDVQEQSDPAHPRYGLWHYFAEESVIDWPMADHNWADFNGMTLLIIWHVAGASFSPALQLKIREAIRRAAICVRRQNTSPHYTNIALKGTFVTMAAAELLGDEELKEYARQRMETFSATFAQADSFAEYNSPTYAAVCLAVLGSIQTYVADAGVREKALVIQHSFWRHLGRHFHVATGELAGPHSRAYHLLIRDSPGPIGPLFERATRGVVTYASTGDLHDAFHPVFTCLLDFDMASDTEQLFLQRDRIGEVREVARRFPAGGVTETASYLHPSFCLGTVNFQDGWEQRHNLLAYWPDASPVGSLLHHYLHDARPCSGGYFASAQREGRVLAASFLSDFADDHPCFQTEGVHASFMGPVLEMKAALDQATVFLQGKGGRVPVGMENETLLQEGETLLIRLPALWLAFTLIRQRSGLSLERHARIRRDGASLRIELPHYQGAARDLRWTDFIDAHTAYGLVMTPAKGDWETWADRQSQTLPQVGEAAESIQVEWGGLTLPFPNRVKSQGEVRDFYRSGPPWDSVKPRRPLQATS